MMSFNAIQFLKNLANFDLDFVYADLRVHVDYDLQTDFIKFFTSKVSDKPDFTLVYTATISNLSSDYDSIFELFANVLK